MSDCLVRTIDISREQAEHPRQLLRREWLVTNGLGGYASGTISGMVSRRYHGVLVAALPAPWGRVVMLNHLSEHLRLPDGRVIQIGGEEPGIMEDGNEIHHYVSQFRLEYGLPIWRYEAEGHVIEKRLVLVHAQNTVHVTYTLKSGPEQAWLELCPAIHFRRHEHGVGEPLQEDYALTIQGKRHAISEPVLPYPLNLMVHADRATFTHHGGVVREITYHVEGERGYHSKGKLWSPGCFTVELRPGRSATLVASTESWDKAQALDPESALGYDTERKRRLISCAPAPAQDGVAAELVLAADQFIIWPTVRVEDNTRARAAGDEVRSVIAGYHWFTDWGRDTMISLEGLTLCTGRHVEAGWILRTFGHYIRDGLIPNLFPEGESEGLYHTADATLWFFHAMDRYLEVTGDRGTLQILLPKLTEVIECHIRGTKFGIGVDPADGLLRQGAEGYQLTWMDAKVGDWVVTPRRGKAVEINALWYNALCLVSGWLREEGRDEAAMSFDQAAARARESFNHRFWSEERGYLFDVVDGEQGDDAALRPNQVLAVSLKHAVLDQTRWHPMMEKVTQELLTPVGLRSL
ncbi:MAG TPA: amylo-alpha-1,6-glucosidase, partial [Verrucomicrobiaceae bacterium]